MTEERNHARDTSAEEVQPEVDDESKNLVEQARELKERYKNPAEVKKDVYLAAVIGSTVMIPIPFASTPYPA